MEYLDLDFPATLQVPCLNQGDLLASSMCSCPCVHVVTTYWQAVCHVCVCVCVCVSEIHFEVRSRSNLVFPPSRLWPPVE